MRMELSIFENDPQPSKSVDYLPVNVQKLSHALRQAEPQHARSAVGWENPEPAENNFKRIDRNRLPHGLGHQRGAILLDLSQKRDRKVHVGRLYPFQGRVAG